MQVDLAKRVFGCVQSHSTMMVTAGMGGFPAFLLEGLIRDAKAARKTR
jgi:hypothetical protein